MRPTLAAALALSLAAAAITAPPPAALATSPPPAAPATSPPPAAPATTALAQASGGGQFQGAVRLFERIDSNGDGLVDRVELAEARAQRFARLDDNGDGQISEAEIERARAAIQRRIARELPRNAMRLDTDGNGVITRDEFMARPYRAMIFDADRNGILTLEEVESGLAIMRP